MRHLFPVSMKRLVPPGLALLAGMFLVPCAAQATPYVVKLVQQGSNVVATGSGEFDLTGLTFNSIGATSQSAVQPSTGYVGTGTQGSAMDAYNGLSGPMAFGSGASTYATTGTGDSAGFNAIWSGPTLFAPQGYVSGTALANSSTWDSSSFASLGITPGTYTWTWGTAADQSFTLIAGTKAVPEPAALGMFGLGMLLIGGFVTRRRRVQPQIG